jgi:hypothetical protein
MRIALLDHMGLGNLGDAATQDAVIDVLRKNWPGVELVGFSLNPRDTEERHGIPCHPITWSYPGRHASGSGSVASRMKARLKRSFVYRFLKPVRDLLREPLHWVRSYGC